MIGKTHNCVYVWQIKNIGIACRRHHMISGNLVHDIHIAFGVVLEAD